MQKAVTLKKPVDVTPAEDIHASFFTLIGSILGLLLSGLGLVLSWRQPSTNLPIDFEAAGSLMLAIAISTHVSHLRKRIGVFGIGLSSLALFLLAAAWTPFVINSQRYLLLGWQQYFYFCWGFALALFSVTGFVALRIKESNKQRREVDTFKEIHISFTSLLLITAGLVIFSIGFFEMSAHLVLDRESWILQVVGPFVIAIGVTLHLEHATKHLGYAGALLGILSITIWALCALPFAINPGLILNPTWGLALSNGLFSLPYFLTAITLGSIALKKLSLEAQGAVDVEFQGL
jgi:hypothetical protein